MSYDTIVKEIAAAAGARLAGSLPATEVVAFRVENDGTVIIELAGGEDLTLAWLHDESLAVPDRVLTAERFLKFALIGANIAPGERLEGRRFVRRRAPGKTPTIKFVEEGMDD
jgi:hypothetical protein